jgi:hypothetical protein
MVCPRCSTGFIIGGSAEKTRPSDERRVAPWRDSESATLAYATTEGRFVSPAGRARLANGLQLLLAGCILVTLWSGQKRVELIHRAEAGESIPLTDIQADEARERAVLLLTAIICMGALPSVIAWTVRGFLNLQPLRADQIRLEPKPWNYSEGVLLSTGGDRAGKDMASGMGMVTDLIEMIVIPDPAGTQPLKYWPPLVTLWWFVWGYVNWKTRLSSGLPASPAQLEGLLVSVKIGMFADAFGLMMILTTILMIHNVTKNQCRRSKSIPAGPEVA